MSIDPSLKVRNALARHRNVLSRAERVMILKEEERWSGEDSLLGLPKVAHRGGWSGCSRPWWAGSAADRRWWLCWSAPSSPRSPAPRA